MKKLSVVILLLLFVCAESHAQRKYSSENLEKLSSEEIKMYFNKAQNQQKCGKITSIVGGSMMGASVVTILILDNAGSGLKYLEVGIATLGVGILGLVTFFVGTNIYKMATLRIKRINAIESKAINNISFDLKSYSQYNYMTQKYQPALTLSISF